MAIRTQIVDLTVMGRLLILLARDQLRPEQVNALPALVSGIEDWDLFINRCEEHFILPVALRHLSILPNELFPQSVREKLRLRAMKIIARALKIAGAQKSFAEKVLVQGRFHHAFVKGQALAGSYYSQPGDRFCRDVDLLVDKHDLVDILDLAQQCGYLVFPDRRILSRRDLVAAAKLRPVACLIGQEGILFEIHSELDKTGLIFTTSKLLASVERRIVHGTGLMVLPTTEHFVFVCLHSTRHLWSHLNWLVDLDALVRSRDFKERDALEFAEELGVLSTVQACLDMYRECANIELSRTSLNSHARDLFDVLTMHVDSGPEIEFEMRIDRPLPDFSFPWQATRPYKLRALAYSSFSSLRPNFKDYEALPLPSYLFWVYYFTRPFSARKRVRARAALKEEID